MCNNTKIGIRHLPAFLRGDTSSHIFKDIESEPSSIDDLNIGKMEQQYIRLALDRTKNNRTEAAKLLGISRRTMQRKLKEMDMVD